MFSVIFLFFFLKGALLLSHLYEYLKSEVPQGGPSDLFVPRQVIPNRVNVLKHALNSPIDVALLGLCFSSEHMWDLGLLSDFLVVLKEEIPAEGRLHVVHECSLLVLFFIRFFLLFGAIRLLLAAVLQIHIDNLFHVGHFFTL